MQDHSAFEEEEEEVVEAGWRRRGLSAVPSSEGSLGDTLYAHMMRDASQTALFILNDGKERMETDPSRCTELCIIYRLDVSDIVVI